MTFKAIKKGTTSYRLAEELLNDEVRFDGNFVYDADGLNSLMIWDEAIKNVRAMNQSEIDAERNKRDVLVPKEAAKNLLETNDPPSRLAKSTLIVILDAFNRQSKQYSDLISVIGLATSLADLKTRVTAISPEPQRTISELKDSIKAMIDS